MGTTGTGAGCEAAEAGCLGGTAMIVSAPIRVTIVGAQDFVAVLDQWEDLTAHTCRPNVFMDPAAALAYEEAWPHSVHALLAWLGPEAAGEAARLVGAWVLVERRPRSTWPWRALVSPPGPVAYLGTPVVDPALSVAVLSAMFATIRDTPELPKLLDAGDMSDGAGLIDDLKTALAATGGRWAMLETRRHAKLAARDDPRIYWERSLSVQRRQGADPKRRQLGRLGSLSFDSFAEPDAIALALAAFLNLEVSGWKAVRGSALANDEATTRFAHRLVTELAKRRLVVIHALQLDGVPVAMWIVLLSGTGAFTWRTTYDENYRRFSPGVLVLENTTAWLMSETDLAAANPGDQRDIGYRSEHWGERHQIVDLLIDAGPARPIRLWLLSRRERMMRACRELVRRIDRRLRSGGGASA